MEEIKLTKLSAYLMQVYGFEVSTKTVYNWVTHGRNDEKLQTALKNVRVTRHAQTRFTTPEWVQSFLDRSGLAAGLPTPGPDREGNAGPSAE